MPKTLIVIAHNNGKQFINRLIDSMPKQHPIVVIDTGSTDQASLGNLKKLLHEGKVLSVGYCDGGFSPGAYQYALNTFRDCDSYFFMHDSMIVKDPDFIQKFQEKGDVVGWLSFPFVFDDDNQRRFIVENISDQFPERGLFGPIFYATRKAMLSIDVPVPQNINEAHGMERGYAVAFKKAGIDVQYFGEWNEPKLRDDAYKMFQKFLPKRP